MTGVILQRTTVSMEMLTALYGRGVHTVLHAHASIYLYL